MSIVHACLAAAGALALSAACVSAQQAQPRTVLPKSLALTPSPTGGGVLSANAVGNPTQGGTIYAVIVTYPAGAKSFPHSYSTQRVFTVISGTWYVGMGPEFDEKTLIAVKRGTLMIMPADAVHYGWAKDGEVVVQELGAGPSGTKLWSRK